MQIIKNWFQEYKLVFLIFLVWQVLMLTIAYFNLQAIPSNPENIGFAVLHQQSVLKAILYSMWNQWDSDAYVLVGTQAYANPIHLAFFPLFPLLIRAISVVLSLFHPVSLRIAGVIASSGCFLASLMVLFTWCKHKFSDGMAYTTLAVLAFFPTSFFLRATYTESLFLLLTVCTFYFVDKKKFTYAAVFCGLASATRLVGVLFIPVIIGIYLYQNWQKNTHTLRQTLHTIGLTILASSGFLLFSLYQYLTTNSFFTTFAISKNYWHRYFSFSHMWEAITNNFHNLFGQNFSTMCFTPGENYHFMIPTCPSAAIINIAFTLVFLIWCIWITWKNTQPRIYQILAWIMIILAIGSGWFDGMPRYILPCFPLYISIAKVLHKYPKIQPFYFAISAILLTIFTLMFTRGEWIG